MVVDDRVSGREEKDPSGIAESIKKQSVYEAEKKFMSGEEESKSVKELKQGKEMLCSS